MLQYIAERLLSINEQKRWTDLPPTDEILRLKQDEEIFQTARLIKYVCYLIHDRHLLYTIAAVDIS